MHSVHFIQFLHLVHSIHFIHYSHKGKGKVHQAKNEKGRAQQAKRQKGKGKLSPLRSNSTRQPSRAHASTHARTARHDTQRFPGWTHPQNPIYEYAKIAWNLMGQQSRTKYKPKQCTSRSKAMSKGISEENQHVRKCFRKTKRHSQK